MRNFDGTEISLSSTGIHIGFKLLKDKAYNGTSKVKYSVRSEVLLPYTRERARNKTISEAYICMRMALNTKQAWNVDFRVTAVSVLKYNTQPLTLYQPQHPNHRSYGNG